MRATSSPSGNSRLAHTARSLARHTRVSRIRTSSGRPVRSEQVLTLGSVQRRRRKTPFGGLSRADAPGPTSKGRPKGMRRSSSARWQPMKTKGVRVPVIMTATVTTPMPRNPYFAPGRRGQQQVSLSAKGQNPQQDQVERKTAGTDENGTRNGGGGMGERRVTHGVTQLVQLRGDVVGSQKVTAHNGLSNSQNRRSKFPRARLTTRNRSKSSRTIHHGVSQQHQCGHSKNTTFKPSTPYRMLGDQGLNV